MFLTVFVLYKGGVGTEGGVIGKYKAWHTVNKAEVAEVDFEKDDYRFYEEMVEG